MLQAARALAVPVEPQSLLRLAGFATSIAIAWRTLCEFIQSWLPVEAEPEPRRLPTEVLPKPDPLRFMERVECKCREYHGTDFWNDPHRWCGVDANHEAFWMKAEPRDCERTFRPKPKPRPVLAVASYNTTLNIGGGGSGAMLPCNATPAGLMQMQMLQQMQAMQMQMQGLAQQNTLSGYLGNQLNSYYSAQGSLFGGY